MSFVLLNLYVASGVKLRLNQWISFDCISLLQRDIPSNSSSLIRIL